MIMLVALSTIKHTSCLQHKLMHVATVHTMFDHSGAACLCLDSSLSKMLQTIMNKFGCLLYIFGVTTNASFMTVAYFLF